MAAQLDGPAGAQLPAQFGGPAPARLPAQGDGPVPGQLRAQTDGLESEEAGQLPAQTDGLAPETGQLRAQTDGLAPEAPGGLAGTLSPERTSRPVFERAEVRDVLAWLRLLIDRRDAAAAVRALGRPPIELRQVDLARVVQIARRRRLDVVSALELALQAPQLAPQARERIGRFQELHGWAVEALAGEGAERFVEQLIERLGLRRRQLFAADAGDVEERLAGLVGLGALAEDFARGAPGAGARELAVHVVAIAAGGGVDPRAREVGGREPLEQTLGLLREEVLEDVTRIGRRLGELRLDTDLDVSHGVVRYLELVKLAALRERAEGLGVEEALADVNARLLAAATPLQREIYESSPLDELLRAAERGDGDGGVVPALAPRGEPSLDAFLRRRGDGLVLSASDVETYRGCPLRYKFARVLRIPTEQTLAQRFGIVVHQALERYHSAEGRAPIEDAARAPAEDPPGGGARSDDGPRGRAAADMMELLDAAWRRAGLGEVGEEGALLAKARAALRRYERRLLEEPGRPLWFERSFAFELGPHHVRGRVDRVDRLPDGSYELIDYKTGYPKTAAELGEDIQLSLYAIAAREAWQLESASEAYYYLLDDRKVEVPRGRDAEWVRDTVLEVGAGILAQDFEPTPSPAVCGRCDYRIVCPAAEWR